MADTNFNAVRSEIRSLARDAQDLFREANNTTGDQAAALRTQAASLLDAVLSKTRNVQMSVVDAGKDMALSTDDYVHVNPWKAIAVSAAIGVLAGVLIARK